jgi:DNA-binding FadR family transcriptional regulator
MPKASDLAKNFSRLIDDRVWQEGQRLPAERALCVQFGTARNTVRKALIHLEREARIVRREGRGFFVSSVLPMPSTDFLADVSRASPTDIMELRLIVEPAVTAIATLRATTDDIDHIERAAQNIEAATCLKEREDADADFHLSLFSATRNPLLVSLCNAINGVRDQAQWFERKRQVLTSERQDIYNRQHREIASAVRRRSADEAKAAMRGHLESLRRDLLGQYAA